MSLDGIKNKELQRLQSLGEDLTHLTNDVSIEHNILSLN